MGQNEEERWTFWCSHYSWKQGIMAGKPRLHWRLHLRVTWTVVDSPHLPVLSQSLHTRPNITRKPCPFLGADPQMCAEFFLEDAADAWWVQADPRSTVRASRTQQWALHWRSSRTIVWRPGKSAHCSGTWPIGSWKRKTGRGWPACGVLQRTRSEPLRNSGQVMTASMSMATGLCSSGCTGLCWHSWTLPSSCMRSCCVQDSQN